MTDPIAIISAMPDEVSQLLTQLSPPTGAQGQAGIDRLAGRDYHVGLLWDTPVVVAFSRWGKVAAASTATHVIERYSPREVIFTGVAGALSPDLNVGDLVVARDLIQHDLDARPLYPRHEIPLLGVSNIPTTPRIQYGLQRSAERFLAQDFATALDTQQREKFGLTQPCVVVGEVCSGDSFIADAEQAAQIRTNLPLSLCVEMEGAAVAQVCWEHGQELGVLRTISDSADDTAHVDFPAFVKDIASAYSYGVLRHYLQNSDIKDVAS